MSSTADVLPSACLRVPQLPNGSTRCKSSSPRVCQRLVDTPSPLRFRNDLAPPESPVTQREESRHVGLPDPSITPPRVEGIPPRTSTVPVRVFDRLHQQHAKKLQRLASQRAAKLEKESETLAQRVGTVGKVVDTDAIVERIVTRGDQIKSRREHRRKQCAEVAERALSENLRWRSVGRPVGASAAADQARAVERLHRSGRSVERHKTPEGDFAPALPSDCPSVGVIRSRRLYEDARYRNEKRQRDAERTLEEERRFCGQLSGRTRAQVVQRSQSTECATFRSVSSDECCSDDNDHPDNNAQLGNEMEEQEVSSVIAHRMQQDSVATSKVSFASWDTFPLASVSATASVLPSWRQHHVLHGRRDGRVSHDLVDDDWPVTRRLSWRLASHVSPVSASDVSEPLRDPVARRTESPSSSASTLSSQSSSVVAPGRSLGRSSSLRPAPQLPEAQSPWFMRVNPAPSSAHVAPESAFTTEFGPWPPRRSLAPLPSGGCDDAGVSVRSRCVSGGDVVAPVEFPLPLTHTAVIFGGTNGGLGTLATSRVEDLSRVGFADRVREQCALVERGLPVLTPFPVETTHASLATEAGPPTTQLSSWSEVPAPKVNPRAFVASPQKDFPRHPSY
eukprot:TRINITY_DN43766_c0_g1_i1.p1 TRINITY_DN43766_c0_g1~~TRINITY_DN43766_c0_g1_i1.p1  ORF type:complete len:621 (+),score=88.26 TRINITY_DN43766_c0_g1_i1:201-2063(+)